MDSYKWFSHGRLEGFAKTTVGSFDKLLKEMDRTPAWYYRTRKNRAMKIRDLEQICAIMGIHPSDVFKDESGLLAAEHGAPYLSAVSSRMGNAVAMLASNQKEFSERTGIDPTHLSYIVNRNGEPGLTTIQRVLSTFPTLSARWLILGVGNMQDDTETAASLRSQLQDKQRIISLLEDQINSLKTR